MTATSTNPETLQPATRVHEQDERRARACINACAGLTTEALEGGIIQKMLISLTTANDALDAHAARAARGIPDGFIPVTERLPFMGEDLQQIIEKRGESVAVLAWRYLPAVDALPAEPDASRERTATDRVERTQVTP
ncbi:hypothetical protein ACVBR5_000950 [Burkholderia cenocepacia]